ncbi:MAG: hypothetical protein AAFP77_19715 [Bacteroidota bacterium]
MANNKPTLEEKLEQALQVIEQQSARIDALESAGTPAEKEEPVKYETPKQVFAVNDSKYKFTVPRYINDLGNTVLAKDSLKNQAELERLVSIQSGIITLAK